MYLIYPKVMKTSAAVAIMLALSSCLVNLPASAAHDHRKLLTASGTKGTTIPDVNAAVATAQAQATAIGAQAQAQAQATAATVAGNIPVIKDKGEDCGDCQQEVQHKPAEDCHDCDKNKPDTASVAAAQAQAAAAAISGVTQATPTTKESPPQKKGDDCKDCDKGQDQPRDEGGKPDLVTCQAAAEAGAKSASFSTGKKKYDEVFSLAKANAAAFALGSDEWRDKFIGFCVSFASASASATSVAVSGK